MSLVIENIAIDGQIALIASLIEDLGAVKRHKIAVDNHAGRHALARYARSLQERYSDALAGIEVTPDVRVMIEAAVSSLRKQRKEAAIALREYRERLEAERAALLASLEGEEGAIAA